MVTVAQTNIQLYSQMRAEGYGADDLERVSNAYRLAAEVCGSKLRGSGKTLLAHLVGTASLLCWLNRPVATISAGLLHAAYEDGDFGRRRPYDELREVAGSDVERLVAGYRDLRWTYTSQQVVDLRKQLDQVSAEEREAAVIRVANELEDHLDLAPLYHGEPDDNVNVPKGAPWRIEYMNAVEEPLRQLAIALGAPALASEIACQFEQIRRSTVEASLLTGHRFIWQVPPRSGRVRRRAQHFKERVARVREVGANDALRRAASKLTQ